MRAIFILTFLLFSMTSLASNQKYNLDSIFSITDQIIKNANLYVQQKEENIKRKKAELTNAKTDGERFMLNRQLYTLYKKYNAERLVKETAANSIGLVSKFSRMKVSECNSYVRRKTDEYLR